MPLQWLSGPAPAWLCPVCHAAGTARRILRCPAPPRCRGPDFLLLGCGRCGAAGFEPAPQPDYAAAAQDGGGALAFYLQQGAGPWSMASTLLSLDRAASPGTRLLEIGCGFGFGLDFARRALGWEVLGHDPSPFAAEGRRLLGLPIEPTPWTPGPDRTSRHDVVLASEVLEHVADPVGFLRGLRGALAPGGVLVLTTPDAAAVRPGTPAGLLLPLLSPGYHTILHTEGSLALALRQAGFACIRVAARGAQLVAHAADRATGWRAPDAADRRLYRDWLDAGAASQPPGSDLHLGFLGRAWREAVNAADRPAADRLLPGLDAALCARFGRRLADWAAPPPPAPSLDALAARGPLSLGPLLLTLGLHRLLAGAARPELLPLFEAAAREASALRRALQATGADDGDAEEAAWIAAAEAALCAAAGGAPDAADRLARLGAAPAVDPAAGEARAAALHRRAFVQAVNAGAYAAGRGLSGIVAPTLARAAAPGPLAEDSELDVLWCAAVLEANGGPEADLDGAIDLLRRLREAALRRLDAEGRAAGSAAGLLWPAMALEHELLGRRGREAERAALAGPGLAALAARPGLPARPADLPLGPA